MIKAIAYRSTDKGVPSVAENIFIDGYVSDNGQIYAICINTSTKKIFKEQIENLTWKDWVN